MSQVPADRSPYPANDTPLTLPSGTTVRVRNVVVFRGSQSNALTLYIETPTAAADSVRVGREAQELVELYAEYAARQGVATVAVGICRTRACLEMREAPAELMRFVRSLDGTWRREATWSP